MTGTHVIDRVLLDHEIEGPTDAPVLLKKFRRVTMEVLLSLKAPSWQ